MMEQQSVGADRARVSQGKETDPWQTMNRLLAILIAMFVLSSGTGGVCFYVVFNRLHDQARDAFVTGCERDNQTRAGSRKFIDSQIEPNKAYARKIFADPKQPASVRAGAKASLARLEAIQVEKVADLSAQPCDYPPILGPPTTSTPSTTSDGITP